jgi:hypothetical protein
MEKATQAGGLVLFADNQIAWLTVEIVSQPLNRADTD